MEEQSDDWLWILEKEKCKGKNGNPSNISIALMKENAAVQKGDWLTDFKLKSFVVSRTIIFKKNVVFKSCMKQTR